MKQYKEIPQPLEIPKPEALGSLVVPFLGVPYRVLNLNHTKGTAMEPMGNPKP